MHCILTAVVSARHLLKLSNVSFAPHGAEEKSTIKTRPLCQRRCRAAIRVEAGLERRSVPTTTKTTARPVPLDAQSDLRLLGLVTWRGRDSLGLIHTGRATRCKTNGTYVHEWECPHCTQAVVNTKGFAFEFARRSSVDWPWTRKVCKLPIRGVPWVSGAVSLPRAQLSSLTTRWGLGTPGLEPQTCSIYASQTLKTVVPCSPTRWDSSQGASIRNPNSDMHRWPFLSWPCGQSAWVWCGQMTFFMRRHPPSPVSLCLLFVP